MSFKVKMFEGVKVVTENGMKFYRDLTVFDVYTASKETRSEIIRALIIAFPAYIDLSDCVSDTEVCKMRLVTENEVQMSKVPWEE